MKNGSGSSHCKQGIQKHTGTAKGLDPRLVASSLAASVNELSHQLHVLQVENDKLSLRQRVLTGMWLASRQAVELLGISRLWSSADIVKRALDAAQALEMELLQSMEAGSDRVDPLELWTAALQPTAGSASELVLRFIDPVKVCGPSEPSVLGGIPCSLLLAVLLCLRFDPQFVQQFLKSQEHGSKAAAAAAAETYAKATKELQALLDSAASAEPHSPDSVKVLTSIAVQFCCLARGMVSGAILSHASGLNENVIIKGAAFFPPNAKLDEIAAKLAITQDQILSILKEQSMYNEIMAPLAKEKGELMACISQALTATIPQPAAAGGGSKLPFGTAAASATSTGRSAAAGGGTLPVFRATAATTGDGLPFGDPSSHSELLRCLSRVDMIQTQLWWLDMCCSLSCCGKFTWWQLGTMVVNFAPFPPLAGMVIRRLVTRTSLTLLLPGLPCSYVEGPYLGGSEAPWHVQGVLVPVDGQAAVSEKQMEEAEKAGQQ